MEFLVRERGVWEIARELRIPEPEVELYLALCGVTEPFTHPRPMKSERLAQEVFPPQISIPRR